MKRKYGLYLTACLLVVGNQSVIAHNKAVVIPLLSDPPVATVKRLFLTNGKWQGNLGGLAGADTKCNAEAKSRGFPGRYQAVLGTDSKSPWSRSIHYPLEYRAPDGRKLQSDFHDLFGSGPDLSVAITPPVHWVWTGLTSGGDVNASTNCQNWTSPGGASGRSGDARAIGGLWLSAATWNCISSLPIYCIEQ